MIPLRRVALLDTETTGLDPETDVCIEVAVCLYDVQRATPLASYASLIHSTANAAEQVNRIPTSALAIAPQAGRVWEDVAALVRTADAFVAHRAEFDFGFTAPTVRDAKPWICSKFDLAWPKAQKPGESLVQLALAHGLGVVHAHRAMSDVDTLSRLLTRVAEMGYALEPLLQRGLRPKAEFQALVSFEEKDLAKAASFGWEASTKRWLRTMAIEDAATLPFRVVRTDGKGFEQQRSA